MMSYNTLAQQSLRIIAVVAAYWFISICMVFINKYLVGDSHDQTDISLFIAWMQCLITVIVILTRHSIAGLIRKDTSISTKLKFSIDISTKSPVLFMSCTFVALLTFNNLCLRHVGVAFFQVARSLTLIFTVVLSAIILRQTIKPRVVLPCLLVAFGFVLGVDQEGLAGTLSTNGVLFGMTTSFFVAMNGILIKQSLDVVHQDAEKLTLYNNINASLLFLPLLLATGQLSSVWNSPRIDDVYFWISLLLSGLMSLAMGWVSALQIQLTSPVTHHISANTKSIVQTLLAVLYYDLNKTWLWWAGVLCVLVGVTVYALCGIDVVKHTGQSSASTDCEANVMSKEIIGNNNKPDVNQNQHKYDVIEQEDEADVI